MLIRLESVGLFVTTALTHASHSFRFQASASTSGLGLGGSVWVVVMSPLCDHYVVVRVVGDFALFVSAQLVVQHAFCAVSGSWW